MKINLMIDEMDEKFIPEQWFDDTFEEKREKCNLPEDIVFKTNNDKIWNYENTNI